ncbi:phycocyanobilin:ferredoxin oxidoreductase [Waterburya agarophytonicola K14]|uniref:Phycocyanobilin:ferredoxin oxidoreductase n=1 Tax=Waterburya agarophytonicola KI4 TaxID=2874699 RepID=A0A964FFM5_9CYAN|nr:phycocyanobilin:ferredoxin oxidoreductase [Waterburya agarophytonicola]MCC0177116.1 phycocyanobilin:ferredoxin oxidoreductase [Waterburya agarophytonicola KI4]
MIEIFNSSLRERQHYLIQKLADCIEEQWMRNLDLSYYSIPEDLGYVEGNLEEERLIIENRCYQTTQFRKLHLELAQVGDRLDILHCVMFPRPNYDLPIFGVDLVGTKAGIGAAIVDLSPVNHQRVLSSDYIKALANLPTIEFSEPRQLPEWGDIFSGFCLFVHPHNAQEEQRFLERVQQYLAIHCQLTLASSPSTCSTHQAEILAGQRHYCAQQQQNDKTRRVLEKSLGKAWTDRYMTQMLFDCL